MHAGFKLLLTITLQFCYTVAFSQLVLNTQHYSTADGLSDNRITVIIKDSEGFMWFGSWAGISRFDGYQFKTFKSYPGDSSPLKSNRIDQIVEDQDGIHLWLAAYDKRIYRFDKRTGRFVSLAQLLSDSSLEKIAFIKILAASNGHVWLRSEHAGLFMLSFPKTGKPEMTIFSPESSSPRHISSREIKNFHLDAQGNVWLFSDKGLDYLKARPGSGFSAQKINIGNQTVITTLAEHGKNMVAGTSDGASITLNKNNQAITREQISKGSVNRILSSHISGQLYFTTALGELLILKKGDAPRLIYKSSDGSALENVYEDSAGALWVGSQRFGVIRIAPESHKASYFYPFQSSSSEKTPRNFAAFEDKDATVYINFEGQMSFFNAKENRMDLLNPQAGRYHRSNNMLRTFYDKAGVLWLGSGYEGIDKIVFQENPFKRILPKVGNLERETNEVRGLFTDKDNRLWVGTKKGEVLVYGNGKDLSFSFGQKLSGNTGVYSIFQGNNKRMYLATKGQGLFTADFSEQGFSKYDLLHFQPNKSINGTISSNDLYSIIEDGQGRIWAGAYDEGLILLEKKNGKQFFNTIENCFRNYPALGYRKIRHLAKDKNGFIWIATTDGLLLLDPRKGNPRDFSFKIYRKEPGNIKSLGGNDIQYIYQDSRGLIWVLTTTGGLNLAVGNNPMQALSFINYSVKSGLPSDFLLSCIEDFDHNLWIATQNGLSRMSPDLKKFQNFTENDGIGTSSFSESSCARLLDGTLAFGTTDGILMFNPRVIHINRINAPMALTNIQINSVDMDTGNSALLTYSPGSLPRLELEHDQNMLNMDFAVLDFHSTNRQNYAYRMLGYDEVWRGTPGQRRAIFTKLPPGKYTFQVKSLNEELYNQTPFSSIEIIIRPPLWRTWWAYLFYFSALGMLVFFVRRNELTMLKLRLQVAIEKEVSELKVAFFNQISHELRTPLSLIINPGEEIQQHEPLSDKGKEYIRIVLSNARRMSHLVNQVLDLRKLQSGKDPLNKQYVEVAQTIRQLIFNFKETIDRRNLDVELICKTAVVYASLDLNKFEILVTNLLSNAIKFSPDGGCVTLNLSLGHQQKNFKLVISDQGKGVDNNSLELIFDLYFQEALPKKALNKGSGIGLALCKEIVELHGGKIYAEHNEPVGLRIVLEISCLQDKERVSTAEPYAYNQNHPALQILQTEDVRDWQIADDNLPLLLIVEDNEEMRMFLNNKFRGTYRVQTAADGEQGYALAEELLPDLILSDIMMPIKSGIELLDMLKNSKKTSHIPVVLLSAKFSIENQIEGIKYGADYYFAKPFDFTLLNTAIENIIRQRKLAFARLVQGTEELPEEPLMTQYDKIFLQKLLDVVEKRLNEPDFNIDEVAGSLGMSRSAFYRKFKSLTDSTPIDFVRETRLRKAREILNEGEDNISVAAYAVGFSSPKYFTLCFKTQYQQTPSEYLKSIRRKEKGKS